MKKYNTRPIDFTGCNPVIAEALKRSEEIKCWAWDQDCAEKPNSCHEVWIVRYWQSADYPYRTSTDSFFRYAEPIPRKVRRIMPPERAIPVLIAEGWKFRSSGSIMGPSSILTPYQVSLMGTSLDGEAGDFRWPPCIIEEVEDDE